jgi:hypothetical protein
LQCIIGCSVASLADGFSCSICWWGSLLQALLTFSQSYQHRITGTPPVTNHEGNQISRDRLVTVIRLLQALMLLMVAFQT